MTRRHTLHAKLVASSPTDGSIMWPKLNGDNLYLVSSDFNPIDLLAERVLLKTKKELEILFC